MNFNSYRGVGYYKPDYFCGILPEIKELRNEFKIRSRTNKQLKKENIESKLKKEGTGKGIHIITRPSREGKMQGYRW